MGLGRSAILSLGFAALLSVTAAQAQSPANYPNRPIRFLVPYAAGANGDIVSRIVADDIQKRLGQPVIVENRAGAGGNIGAVEAARSPPDGYTIVLGTSTHATNMTLYSDPHYNLEKDFKPVSEISVAPSTLLVNPSLPVKNLSEFIALAKAEPGKLNYSSAGNGSSSHVLMELFKNSANLDLKHIPYSAAAAAVVDLIAGRVQASINGVSTSAAMIKAGQVRPLAIVGTRRSAVIPDVPTFEESGIKGMEQSPWQGILVPAATPDDIVKKLNGAIVAALADPATKSRFDAIGSFATSSTPEDFGKLIHQEVARYHELLQSANIKLD